MPYLVLFGGACMRSDLINLTYEIELQPGEKLTLPEAIVDSVGAGRWIVTIRPLAPATTPIATWPPALICLI